MVNRVLDKICEILSWAWLAKLIFGFGDLLSPAGLPRVHLRYGKGKCVCLFGSLPLWALKQVAETLQASGVSRAVIKQTRDGKFSFSISVPQPIRQKIRNVMVWMGLSRGSDQICGRLAGGCASRHATSH